MSIYKLVFDPTEPDDGHNVGAYLRSSDGSLLTHSDEGGKKALDVSIANTSIEVTATDLDIRDLSASSDNIAISDGTDTLAIETDGSINVNANFSGPIKFRNNASAVVDVEEDTAPLPVKLQGLGGDITVTAGDLNVQLSSQGVNFDSVRIGDASNTAGITANGELKVSDKADSSLKASAQSVTSTASQIAATALAERKKVRLQNRSRKDSIYIGGDALVTASSGYEVAPGGYYEDELGPNCDLYAISDNAAVDVRVVEIA